MNYDISKLILIDLDNDNQMGLNLLLTFTIEFITWLGFKPFSILSQNRV